MNPDLNSATATATTAASASASAASTRSASDLGAFFLSESFRGHSHLCADGKWPGSEVLFAS